MPLREKIETIAREIYGASGVDFTPGAAKKLADYEALGYASLPIRDVRLSAGAGFVTPLCGDMRTMPGLPPRPAGDAIDIDANADVVVLF